MNICLVERERQRKREREVGRGRERNRQIDRERKRGCCIIAMLTNDKCLEEKVKRSSERPYAFVIIVDNKHIKHKEFPLELNLGFGFGLDKILAIDQDSNILAYPSHLVPIV